jgi:antitoxin component of RelBE/YafQ-DinJ toxin-antitoxin module
MDEHIKRIMASLGVTEQEAKEIAAADKAIDKGEPMPFDLTKEQEKVTRAYRQADRKKPVIVSNKPRERKADESKRFLVSLLAECVAESGGVVEITNPERQIDFEYCGRKFRIVLSAPRS